MNQRNYGHYILVLWLATIGYPLFKFFVYFSYKNIEPIYFRMPTLILGLSFLLGCHLFPKMRQIVDKLFLGLMVVTTVEFLYLVSKYFNTPYSSYYFIGSFIVTICSLVAFKEKKNFLIYLGTCLLSYGGYLSYAVLSTDKQFRVEIFNETVFILAALFIVGLQVWNNIKNEELFVKTTNLLEEKRLQLVNSSKMASLGEMAGGMAHEINNPLQIISGNVEILEEDPGNLGALESIKDTVIRINKVVEGLRIFSRDGSQAGMEPTLLMDVLNETLNLCNEKFKKHGIRLNVDVSMSIYINCNHIEISRVFLNLLNNAFDAIQEESKDLKEVNISSQVEGDDVIIKFQDTGKAITEELRDKLFQPFFTTKAIGKGTGLGLSISQGVIEKHGGKLSLDLNPKTFNIKLPINGV